MKLGLRLQILVLLGVVLGLAFVPLYFAISTYTEVAIARVQRDAARQYAHATAVWVETSPRLDVRELEAAFPSANDGYRVVALGVYGADLEPHHVLGSPRTVELLPATFVDSDVRELLPDEGGSQRLLDCHAGSQRRVCAVVAFQPGRAGALNRLVGLYMALIAVALLAGTYFSVTGLIIRPLDLVSRAAQRVGSAEHRLNLPQPRSRELSQLVASLERMTEKLALEESTLRHKVHELEQARVQLETAQTQLVRSERLASVGQLAAGLAHEIGNPIAAMQGMTDLILEGDLAPDQRLDFTRRIRTETDRINRIIRDLLDFARPSTSSRQSGQPANVEAAVNETVTLVSPQPIMRQVRICLDVYPDLPRVSIEHGELMQVILNLVLNAAAACKDGGRVELEARRQGDVVRIVVQDDGPGVPEAMRDKIFEPFVTSKDVGEGTGLGLSVCRGLVEANGGRIDLEPSLRGARFCVELGVAPEAS